MTTYSYVWEFFVQPEHVAAFEAAYGPEGAWAELFQRDPAYIRTDLLRDLSRPGRYLTVDHWATREACLSFRERFRAEFDALDARCERLAAEERPLGDFEVLA